MTGNIQRVKQNKRAVAVDFLAAIFLVLVVEYTKFTKRGYH
jgi:hypothetical protein